VIKNFSLYLALRYLRPKRTFVSVITIISVLGVTLGVAALIVVISVMAGFQDEIKKVAMGYDSHIEAKDLWGTSMLGEKKRPPEVKEKSWRDVLKEIKQTPGVTSATPLVRGMILIEANGNIAPTLMLGMRSDDTNRIASKHEKLLVEGTFDLSEDNIILDDRLARAWGVQLGDKVTVYAPSNLQELMRTMREIEEKPEADKQEAYKQLKNLVAPRDLKVSGIFAPPKLQDMSDFTIMLVPLHVAQELYGLDDGISSLGIEVTNPYEAGEIKKLLIKSGALPESWEGLTWMEQHKTFFAAVQNETEMMYFVLFIIVVVAAFCVMNTMITVTVQKRREIGIISALGSRIGQIMWVFLSQGMIVGALGAASGLGLGLIVVFFRNDLRNGISMMTGRQIFDSSIYGVIEIPAKVVLQDVGIICSGAFLLCTLAALVPAFIAARTEPAIALRD
jgi:lipoprotein-releasing system permease protein